MDILAEFWHGTPNLYDVKLHFITPELKNEIKKDKLQKHHKNKNSVYSLMVYILYHFMAAYGTCQLHRYIPH